MQRDGFVARSGGVSRVSPRFRAVLLVCCLIAAILGTDAGAGTVSADASTWEAYVGGERACPGAGRSDLPATVQTDAMACLVNFARKHRGLRRLTVDAVLTRASEKKAAAIRRCGAFAHDPCGDEWTAAARAAGYRGALGENLFIANQGQSTPRAAIAAWLNSPPHRRNLFRRLWRIQGVTLATFDQPDGPSALWVMVMGDRQPARESNSRTR